MSEDRILYGLDDKPPLARAVVLGLQHVLTMFGATVAVPLMLGPQMGMSQAEIALLISSVMLCSGVATLLQATFGSRLPIIQGVSFSFLPAFAGLIIPTVLKATDEGGLAGDGATCMQYIAGAVILGGVVEAIIGFTGLVGVVRRYLSPVVIGPVIMLIGLQLYQAGAPLAASHWPTGVLTMALVILFSLVLSGRGWVFRLFPMLLAIVASVAVCGALTSIGVYGDIEVLDDEGSVVEIKKHPASLSFDAYESAETFRTSTVLLPWGAPRFSVAFTVAVLAAYLASMIESIGDYHACKQLAGGGDPTESEISRGIGFEGVGCALSGLLGGFSSTSYSENIGLVGLTKVGSRYVVQIGAVMLVLLGLFGKFGALAAAIPTPIVGGLYCTLFGLIAAIGVRQFAKADLSSDRNLFIGGFALFMGLSVPFYFGEYGSGQADAEWMAGGLKDVVIALGSTGMAVAAILGITLDNLIPGTKQERGLHDPGVVTPQVADVDDV